MSQRARGLCSLPHTRAGQCRRRRANVDQRTEPAPAAHQNGLHRRHLHGAHLVPAMPIPILMYHQIDAPPPRRSPGRGLWVPPARFRRQMRLMHRLGYRGLSMRDLMPYLHGERSGKVFGITFDDGFRNVFEHAMPALDALGFTATNYFVSRQLSGSNVWDRDLGIRPAALMSVAQMRAWHQGGHEVGSHTLDHVDLRRMAPHEARRQIATSKDELEQWLGVPVTAFCYPYGSQDAAHREMVREAGYANATITARGLARASDDPFGLPRVSVYCGTGMFGFLRKCLTAHEDRWREA
ncbi:putative polysaccharide deacetylase [Cupriavidus phytorum]|uniref:Polysaccharide deacetylase n=3 Tax=Cupriavidus TaxID=106589 RepID=A0A976A7K6_9BURK|nr:polysaccharide deacetylase [Cupriavidus alkaliphilus]SOY66005.1 putative polysaccharide deacetylase [Cupriavidus taiwanensis]